MNVSCHAVWNARNREEALALALETFGPRGEKLVPPLGPIAADPSDAALFTTSRFLSAWIPCVAEMFPNGLWGYIDDRLADGNGWGTFDVKQITCPVTVLHGADDGMIPVANAHHTAAMVPGATLRVFDGLGHLGIVTKTIEVTSELVANAGLAR